MSFTDSTANVAGGTLVAVGNLFAWASHTEQIWFPAIGAYVRFVAPEYNLPDLRGPFLFLTLLYIGFRIGDLLDERDDLTDS